MSQEEPLIFVCFSIQIIWFTLFSMENNSFLLFFSVFPILNCTRSCFLHVKSVLGVRFLKMPVVLAPAATLETISDMTFRQR